MKKLRKRHVKSKATLQAYCFACYSSCGCTNCTGAQLAMAIAESKPTYASNRIVFTS